MAAGITLARAREVFERHVGCVPDQEILNDAIASSIEFVLLNGGGEILREWLIVARDGKFTFPRSLETPLKYKFSRSPSLGFGIINSPYFSYSSSAIQNCCGFLDWQTQPQFEIKANKVGTQLDPPRSGLRLVATTRNDNDIGKKIMVSGEWRGKEVTGMHNGWKTAGEILTLYHEDDTAKKFSAYPFDKITGVTKDLTEDWMMLSGVTLKDSEAHFLAHYHPDDETVQFIQGELFSGCCGPTNCDICLHVLGRINPSLMYKRDEDILPISSNEMLQYLARRLKYEEGGDLEEVAAMEQRIRNLIRQQIAYQQKTGRSVSVNLAGSGCTLTNA